MRRYLVLACVWLMLVAGMPFYASADWAYRFVVNDGDVFVVSDEFVEESAVGEQIGEVTYYSDREDTYSGNFSNVYPKGTKYYSIDGISSDESIAIQTRTNSYIKATIGGKYAGGTEDYFPGDTDHDRELESNNNARVENGIIAILIITVLLIVVLVILRKRT